MIEPGRLAPRRIPRRTRYSIVGGVGCLAAVAMALLSVQAGDGGTVVMVLMFALALVVLFTVLIAMNTGFKPRLQGQYLEATTVLGRQSLDLAALTGARWQRSRSSTAVVLRDPVTEMTFTLPVGGSVHGAIREALVAAGRRGVVLPRKVTGHFGLPTMPGAPRSGLNVMPWLLGFAFGLVFAGVSFAYLSSR